MAAPDTFLIDHGDLGSLALLALQPDPSRLLLWHPRSSGGRLRAARLHGEICGRSRLIVSEPCPPALPDGEHEHLEHAVHLLRAAAVAMHSRCNRILWPISIGPNHARIAEAIELAVTMAGVADPSGSLLIDAPIVDLDDAQLVELAFEAGAPMRAFWPCDHDGEEPCGSCGACRRWRGAFDEAAVEWPGDVDGSALRAVNVSAAS